MAEIARLNLSAPVFDPSRSLRGESALPTSERIRRGRQDALNNALKMYQIKGAKYQMEQVESLKRSDEFLAKNASNLFNYKADPMNPESWKFTKPGARAEFYKQWKEEVGGNWQGFQAAYGAAKKAESEAMQKRILNERFKYRTEGEYKRAFSSQMNSLSEGERNQLFTHATPELYSMLQQTYVTKDASAWEAQDILDPLVSGGWMERDTAEAIDDNLGKIGLGAAGVVGGIAALRKGRPKQAWDAAKKLFGGKAGKETAEGATKQWKQGTQMELFGGTIPSNKVGTVVKDVQTKVKLGELTGQEGKQLELAFKNVSGKNGGDVPAKEVAEELAKTKTGQSILKKIGGGLGIVGLTVGGSAVGGKAGEIMGQTDPSGRNKGAEIGALGGAQLLPGMFTTMKSALDKKGASWVMKKIVSVGGPALAARTVAKVGLGSIGGLFSGGTASLFAAGWLAADIALIYNILKEEEDKGVI